MKNLLHLKMKIKGGEKMSKRDVKLKKNRAEKLQIEDLILDLDKNQDKVKKVLSDNINLT